MSDKVFISGLRAETVIGVYDWERNIRQPLVFDIEMATDVKAAAKDDDLTQAIDYAAISQRVIEATETSSFQLIETLAEHLAAIILKEFGVGWVQIRVLKPTAVAEADAVGVQIQRGSCQFGLGAPGIWGFSAHLSVCANAPTARLRRTVLSANDLSAK